MSNKNKEGVSMDIGVLIKSYFISFSVTLIITPSIKILAKKLNAVDKPDNIRKTHKRPRPSLGGLAIFLGVVGGYLFLKPVHYQLTAIILGAIIMVLTGVLDDIYNLKPYQKLVGQLGAAIIVVSSGLIIEKITLPIIGVVYLGFFGIIITIIWIIGVSNAINLIDGLDGLAGGVSTIALSSILVMAIMDQRMIVIALCVILIGANLGFLPHNFYPAKIFMGDTGALFLGYSIAIVSMLGLFKKVAFFSFIVPIIVIAIPIFDTIQAITRRIANKQGISHADKKHIHYQLMERGYSHRTTVLILYAFSIFFGAMAIFFNNSTLVSSFAILFIIVLGIQLIAEMAGMTHQNRQPMLNWLRKFLPIDKWTTAKTHKSIRTNKHFHTTTRLK